MYRGTTMAHIRQPRDYTPQANETGGTSGYMYEYIIAGFGFCFLAIFGYRLLMQRRRHRSETVNTSFQSVKGSKPNCYGVWLGGPVLEAWEWKDIQPLSIEKLSSPAVLEAPPPKQPHRCPWLRLAKPQQDSKCVSTEFHSEPKLRDAEDASVELRIAVLVAMPSRKALRSRGYMNVGVAGVPCGAS